MTPATGDNDTSIATTAFVKAQSYITTSALTPYAPIASPAFSGSPTAPTPAAANNSTAIATTAWVNSEISTAGNSIKAVATIADVAPSTPAHGTLWWNSANGNLYIFYNDGSSMQWVQINSVGSVMLDFPSSPTEGQVFRPGAPVSNYTYRSGTWIKNAGTASSYNRVVNPAMQIVSKTIWRIAQLSAANAAYYIADQW